MFVYENGFRVLVTGDIETRYLSFLVRESKCIPQGGMEGVCWMAVGCIQPKGVVINQC